MPAIAPSNIETHAPNEYYPSAEKYVFAIAEAMRDEYRAIVDAGFLLQIDDPFLVTYYITKPELSIADCRKWGELRVEALNTRSRVSRRTRCASTPATASTWARAFTTWSSRTSSTSS